MTDKQSDLIGAFKSDVADAISFTDSDLSPARAFATKLYNAEAFGDEEEGRSQIVTPTVREVVRATLPSLMRVFFGGMRVVQFEGTNETSAEYADEMTESVDHIFMRQNPGFEIAWDVFKDALVRKVGWATWYWDESVVQSSRLFSGVTIDQLAEMDESLSQDEKLEVVEGTEDDGPPQLDEMGQPVPPQVTYKVRLISKKSKKKVAVESVPPEEIIVSRDAKSPYTAKLIGRRSLKSKGELRGMGIKPELIEEAGGGFSGLDTNSERRARQYGSVSAGSPAHETDDQKKILYIDAFYRVDADNDGISELRHICTLGDNFVEVHNEYADDVRLAAFCPDPEPHTVWGLSQADNVGDLQIINSHVLRDVLDSGKASIFPRMAYVEGQANVDDVMNTEIGAAIRMRSIGAVQALAVPFLGQQMLPILDYLEASKESRTGLSRNAAGLDPRALQSTNQVAVAATVTASQAQVELIARIFAETGMRRLFRGIIKTLVENHRGQFSVPIRGKFRDVNPLKWDVDAELKVDTGLGVGSNDQKIGTLNATAASQTLALQTLGLENPLCSLAELYHTQKTLLQLQGFRDVHRFWRDPALADESLDQQQPEPSPEQVLAEAQMKIEAGKLDLNTLETVLKDDRERDKIESDAMLRAIEISAKYGTTVDVAAIKAAMDRKRIDAQALKAKTAA